MSYFINYPLVRYFGNEAVNLLVRAQIIREIFDRYDVYYPYVIKDSDSAEILAYRFYEDATLSWVIYFANDIFDPYHDWVLSDRDFNAYLEKKYDTVPFLLQNEISHYIYTGLSSDTDEDIARKNWKITPETWNNLTSEEKSGWSSVSVYDDEFEKNEKKRNIRILSPQYLPQITREIQEIFS